MNSPNGFKSLEASRVPPLPHPQFKGVTLRLLLTASEDGAGVTCALVRLPTACEPFPHIHEDSDDLIYVLEGRGNLEVEGLGLIALRPGSFARVPKGVLHTPRDIEQDLLFYNVWSPAIR